MNHEENETQCSSSADDCDGNTFSCGIGQNSYYANMDNLHCRVRDMLRNGISIEDVLSEIEKDKHCTRLQKFYIKQEIHRD